RIGRDTMRGNCRGNETSTVRREPSGEKGNRRGMAQKIGTQLRARGGQKVRTFVANSLHFVAFCNPLAVAKCNEAGFRRTFTYETPVATPATNALRKAAFVAVLKNFVAARCRFRSSPFFTHFAPSRNRLATPPVKSRAPAVSLPQFGAALSLTLTRT